MRHPMEHGQALRDTPIRLLRLGVWPFAPLEITINFPPQAEGGESSGEIETDGVKRECEGRAEPGGLAGARNSLERS